jgi:hypothetical protein
MALADGWADMNNYFAPGDTAYIVRSGMPEYINRTVTVLGVGEGKETWKVQAPDDWAFPNGLRVVDLSDTHLSARPK